jgi:16S rRNA (guanine527-N7)-methyltransferase
MFNVLIEGARAYGVTLSDTKVSQFERYLSLLTEHSAHVNLVASAEPELVVRRHFLESIALGAALREREIMREGAITLDLGAGAGFPGVVLKIVWPDLRMTLLDATAKKTAFLATLVEGLGLEGVEVVTGRAEAVAHDPRWRGRFDLVVARAVAPLAVLAELGLPFARVGGYLVSPKGSRAAAEVAAAGRALELLGGRADAWPFEVPGPRQTLVAVRKLRATPSAYPRREGVPAKSPL